MRARVIGWLRRPRGSVVRAMLVLVAIGALLGVWRLVDLGVQRLVKGTSRLDIVEIRLYGESTGHISSVHCKPRSSFWGPRFDSDVAAWSPDGSEVYFADRGDLQGVRSDGSRHWLIAKNELSWTSFAVAPDGMRLVHTDCRPETDTLPYGTTQVLPHQSGLELVLVRRGGGGVEQLTANVGVDFYPAWSPDGRRIAFLSDAGRSERTGARVVSGSGALLTLFTMAADGTDVRQVLDDEFLMLHQPPQWSPDGQRLAVIRYVEGDVYSGVEQQGREFYVVDADGEEPQRLAADVVSGPSWSPDGQRVAYARATADEVALYTIGSDGVDERRVAGIPHWRGPRPNSLPAEAWIDTVAWSPDGTRILVRSHPRAPAVCRQAGVR